jgi:hypothetical protein
MTPRQYNFLANMRLFALFILIIVILFHLFEIFIDHRVEFATVGPAIGLTVVLVNFLYNKPAPPNEQPPAQTPDANQN